MTCRHGIWEDGERTKDLPIEPDIGSPAFCDSASDYLLQMADFIAHVLVKQEKPFPREQRLGIGQAFGILALSTAGRRSETHGPSP